jgi:hypothetical protein
LSKEYIKAQTPLPAYFPYPKFLLQMSLSHTARLTYVLLLDRMTLSQKNGWVDVQGRAYVLYPLAGLAEDLQCHPCPAGTGNRTADRTAVQWLFQAKPDISRRSPDCAEMRNRDGPK